MDQRQTTEAALYERAFPPRDLAYWLGTLLNAPLADIPTVEDLEREQGRIGLPTREQSNRQAGQDLLDWAAQAFGLGSILRGSAAGRQQDLMSKGRGEATFGKEMMETSRRAQPQKWREILEEDIEAPLSAHITEQRRTGQQYPNLPDAYAPWYGRKDWRERRSQAAQAGHDIMPPQQEMVLPPREPRPSDAVHNTVLARGDNDWIGVYRIGEPVVLPDGRAAYYMVRPGRAGLWEIELMHGADVRPVQTLESVGQALAKARQLQNRLALAAKDMERVEANPLQPGARQIRFPWERGADPRHGVLWRYDYETPPATGRWGQ